MVVIEILNLIALSALGIFSSFTDLKNGLIYNKVLGVFAIYAVLSDVVLYAFFAKNLVVAFLINTIVISVISLYLFFSHSFAGGDCKLTIVFSLLFPASFYVEYNSHSITLFLSLGIALVLGYFYLLFSSAYALTRHKAKITVSQVKTTLLSFAKSFVIVILYVCAINILLSFVSTKYFEINIWIVRIVCIMVAYIVNRVEFFKRWYAVLVIAIVDIAVCVALKIVPISLNPENYLLVLVLLFCQMTIQSDIYKIISVSELKKGMILSTASSAMMQNSRVRGLPELSFEDLRSRLTQEEVNSIGRWSKNTGVLELSIVKKIPFAIFIFLGFVGYFIIWSLSV